MAQVTFTKHLKRFFPTLKDSEQVGGTTVREVLDDLDKLYPGFSGYVVDELGRLRRHVNIFVRQEPIYDREELSDKVGEADEVFIVQALSGG
ncbi:MAG: MoaD/ThiS family protein [Deltaproteobacteria bacterium]|jgi:sulfur-carrier protein|nr:MoaD/ThiS family protein [Deltaproteobacteria bacterium]MDQ3299578.1 MoaD/ThiS family protein [Myxococcota bacterium]